MNAVPREVLDEVWRVVADLAAEDYEALYADGRLDRLTEGGIRKVLIEYGCGLVPLPSAARELSDVYEADGEPRVYMVDQPLWTRDEGRSDLTLSVTVIRRGQALQLRVDDIHVL
jgi:hypothetical protein